MSATSIEPTHEATPPLLLRNREAAEMLGISSEKMSLLMRRGEVPGVVRIVCCVRVHRPTLVRWLEERISEAQKGGSSMSTPRPLPLSVRQRLWEEIWKVLLTPCPRDDEGKSTRP